MHAVKHHEGLITQDPLIHHHQEKEEHSSHRHNHHAEYAMVYSDEIEDKIDILIDRLSAQDPGLTNKRWHAIKLLEHDPVVMERHPVQLADVAAESMEKEIINQKYDFIEEIIQEVLVNKSQKAERTERVDRIMTSRFLGLPIFLFIMAFVFFITFTVGDWMKGYFELGLVWFSDLVSNGLEALHANPLIRSLIVDGIISGVGGILTFLPNIFILFLALAFSGGQRIYVTCSLYHG